MTVPGSGSERGVDAGEGVAATVRSFPTGLAAVRAARHFVAGLLAARGDPPISRDAVIVAAELAANAAVHARTGFTVAVEQSADWVRILIWDGSPLKSGGEGGSLEPAPGHGLDIVSKLARRWAVEPRPDGKVIWAELGSPRGSAR